MSGCTGSPTECLARWIAGESEFLRAPPPLIPILYLSKAGARELSHVALIFSSTTFEKKRNRLGPLIYGYPNS